MTIAKFTLKCNFFTLAYNYLKKLLLLSNVDGTMLSYFYIHFFCVCMLCMHMCMYKM